MYPAFLRSNLFSQSNHYRTANSVRAPMTLPFEEHLIILIPIDTVVTYYVPF